MTFDPIPFDFFPAFMQWTFAVVGLFAIVLLATLLISLAAGGLSGPKTVIAGIWKGIVDLFSMSPRRIWALALLTFKESVRRKALMVFVVFAILFMFAGWFLSDTNSRSDLQIKVYVSFVLTAISWLILPVVLLLACWGLPEDIRLRTLHTVVTKPVRRSEVVVGRMLGFSLLATLVLMVMSSVGYVWIQRMVPPDVKLTCRVPVYGTISFLDREGLPADAGVNTGDIWEFRSYIEGLSKARAIWDFTNLQVAPDTEKLTVECQFEAFRTHKGTIDKGLFSRFVMINPDTQLRVPLPSFEVHEFTSNLVDINRKLSYYDEDAAEMKTYDLVDDIISDGKMRIEVECLERGQLLGMARPDLFIRMPDRPFAAGFFKAIFGIWLMLTLVIVISVTASCFVKGPVATLTAFSLVILGQGGFVTFMDKLVSGQQDGGGTFESVYRLLAHMNPHTAMPESTLTHVIKTVDAWGVHGLWLIRNVVPDLNTFHMAPYVANGFDVSFSAAILPSICMTLGFLIPCVVIGYFSLSVRELEAK